MTNKIAADPAQPYRGLIAGYTDAIRQSDFKANIGGKHFIVSRNATVRDFANVVEAEDELEQLKLRCSVLSELLWWKTLYIRISFFVAMASIVASMFLLLYIWYV
jgi:hypothetical protein